MSRTLDIEKVDAALSRAAFKALHGTREERSGRFLPVNKQKASRRRDTENRHRQKTRGSSERSPD